MYENKLEFPGERGGGVQNKNTFRGESKDIFWNCTFIKYHMTSKLHFCHLALYRNVYS